MQFDVGQGDATLITTPEGRRILIDGGPQADGVAGMLASAQVDTIDLVIASHNHADHIGGLPQVFARFHVKAYLDNELVQPTAIFQRLVAELERHRGLRVLAASSRTITVGSVVLRVLPPSGVDSSQNNNSVGVVLEFGRFRALLTGDSEQPELDHWIQRGLVPEVTVLKVAHHGSQNGTTATLVRATHPSVVVISVGEGNRYGHPSIDVERLWANAGATEYRTDRDGSIEATGYADGRFSIRTHVSSTLRGKSRDQ